MRGACSGTGLIEVAIALLVLAVGTLGVAGLQLAAKKVGHDAVQRGTAAVLAVDLLERIRANPSALPVYRADRLGAAAGSSPAPPAVPCGEGTCSDTQRALLDLWQWERAVNGELASGASGGLVQALACVVQNGRLVTVDISWQGSRAAAALTADQGCGAAVAAQTGRRHLRLSSWISRD